VIAMLIRQRIEPPSSEITPEAEYLNRREFLGMAGSIGALSAGGALVSAVMGGAQPVGAQQADEVSSEGKVTSYNNYYEFGTDKEDPKANSQQFRARPWSVKIEGLCKKTGNMPLDDLLRPSRVEDRVYRFRCVEAWSAVIPWRGIPLADVIRRAEPLPSARFVEMTTLFDPAQMPGQRRATIAWPYIEGLRLDEAMHPLALLATGMYGKTLPNQNGAPLRLVVPWKYGFKSIKAVVKLKFTEQPSTTTWMQAAPSEYGFFANVNPTVDHPRWSQARERKLGDILRKPTLMFNGYAEQVSSLYAGMDLRRNF
jgi:methionine sulfoxide reductase catalytic subunit